MAEYARINEAIRFSQDSPEFFGLEEIQAESSDNARRFFLSEGVRISPNLFPEVFNSLENAKDKLGLSHSIEGFVIPDASPKAACIALNHDIDFIITLSSGLIQLLDEHELNFVVGHEVGHFIFAHHRHPHPNEPRDAINELNALQLSRAAEISVDRTGFLCCDSIENAARTILKIATGLGDDHLRFDISAYLSQLRDLQDLSGSQHEIYSTHPTLAVRLKALLFFSMSQPYFDWIGNQNKAPLSKNILDSRIEKDLSSSAGNELEKIRGAVLGSIKLWGIAAIMAVDNRITKAEQIVLHETFDRITSQKLIRFVSGFGPSAGKEIEAKLNESIESVQNLTNKEKTELLDSFEKVIPRCSGENTALLNQLKTLKAKIRI